MPSGRNRKLEESLGKKLLYERGQGANYNDSEAASARRLIEGSGTARDLEVVRNALGIKKSGASGLKRFQKRVNNVAGRIGNIDAQLQLYEQASAQGQGTIAGARLFQTLNNEAINLTNSKFIKNITKSIFKTMGSSSKEAGQFIKSIGRGLRLGGAIAQIALATAGTAERYFTDQRRSNRAIGARRDLIRAFSGSLDPTQARAEERDITKSVMGERGLKQQLFDLLGFSGDTQEQITKRLQNRLATLAAGRGLIENFGLDRNTALARYARSRNKTIGELSSNEINQAMDSALKDALDPKRFINDPWVSSKMDIETSWKYNLAGNVYKGVKGFFIPVEEQLDAERRKYAEERVELEIKTMEAKKRDLHILAQQARERRDASPVNAVKERESRKFDEQIINNIRSRRRPINYD